MYFIEYKELKEKYKEFCENNSKMALQILINNNKVSKDIFIKNAYLFKNKEDGKMYYSEKTHPESDGDLILLSDEDYDFLCCLIKIGEYIDKKDKN